MEFVVRNMEELERAAGVVLDDVEASDAGATIVTLSGELGAGKTAFAQAVARILGITEQVTSPTFVIEKEYDIPEGAGSAFSRLTHIDAYRLTDDHELDTIGWGDIIRRPRSLILLEWPERIPSILTNVFAQLRFEAPNEAARTISYVRTA